jgi:hypothetical protein
MTVISVFDLIVTDGITTRFKPFQIGIFTNYITKETVGMGGLTRVNLSVKNWEIVLEENDEGDKIDFTISSSRGVDIDFSEGSITDVKIESSDGYVKWETWIKLPTNVKLPNLYFTIEGTKKNRLHDEGDFGNYFNFDTLSVTNNNANFLVDLDEPHSIESFIGSGAYLASSFKKVKITNLSYEVTAGFCHIVQNSAFASNTVKMQSPLGTYCASGTTIVENNADSGCTSINRDSDHSSDTIDTTSYWTSDIKVCSIGTCGIIQGTFDIKIDTGPIAFSIDGDSSAATKSYLPSKNQFTATSIHVLNENKEEFSDRSKDPILYVYDIKGPEYRKVWVHSSKRQFLEAKPWIMFLLSAGILNPSYYYDTLIEIPSSCPLVDSSHVTQDYYISERLK